MERKRATDFPQELLGLFDHYGVTLRQSFRLPPPPASTLSTYAPAVTGIVRAAWPPKAGKGCLFDFVANAR
jgi:hypothetical protein